MGLKLHVRLIEGRDLAPKDANGLSDPYVVFQFGKQKAKSSVVEKSLQPVWNEEFFFAIDDIHTEVLQIVVWDHDFLGTADFMGRISISAMDVYNAPDYTLGPSWFPLEKRHQKQNITGDILLAVMILGQPESPDGPFVSGTPFSEADNIMPPSSPLSTPTSTHMPSLSPPSIHHYPSPPFQPLGSPTELSDSANVGEREREREGERERERERHSPIGSPIAAALGSFSKSIASRASSHRGLRSRSATTKQGNDRDRDRDRDRGDKPEKERPAILKSFTTLKSQLMKRSSVTDKRELPKWNSAEDTATTVSSVSGLAHGEVLLDGFWQDDGGQVPGRGLAEMPAPFQGGVVLDHKYLVSARRMNAILFGPNSRFQEELAEVTKKRKLDDGEWLVQDGRIVRIVTYMTAPSTLIKSTKATELQVYTSINEGAYVVELTVNTPDVPYGNTFCSEVQFIIAAGVEPGTSHLRVSWRANFVEKTMMKGMIEKGMGQGIKDLYLAFAKVLANHAPLASTALAPAEREEVKPRRNAEVAWDYLSSCSLYLLPVFTLILGIHLKFADQHKYQGIERFGIDLPDSLSELFFASIVAISAEHLALKIWHFVHARVLKTGDHGVKSKGTGWLVTVTLLDAQSLGTDGGTLYDPYVVFTCNGKTRTSSVKLQTVEPKWNEVLEFDAMDEPPSTLMVEVFEYGGPFAEPDHLGHSEINFVKRSTKELENLTLPLEGRRARAAHSSLRLRVFLTKTTDAPEALPRIFQQVEREVGKKMERAPPKKNASFQKLFSLPEHEYLIKDYSAAIKKAILIQGRAFVSTRTLAFYSNIFGHKTKFILLWEDIDDIKEDKRPVNRINPSITIYVKKGRGQDASSGSYGTDSLGRLKLKFQSFVKPGSAFRVIDLLWKNRTLTPEQQIAKVEEVEAGESSSFRPSSLPRSTSDAPSSTASGVASSATVSTSDDDESIISIEEPQMTEATVLELPISVEAFWKMMYDPECEQRMAEEMELLDYKTTPWVELDERPGTERRLVTYAFSRRVCPLGASATIVQQCSKGADNSWARLDENMSLHHIPFADRFQVEIRKEIASKGPNSSVARVLIGIAWNKETKFKKKMEKNILDYNMKRVKKHADFVLKEVIAYSQRSCAQQSN